MKVEIWKDIENFSKYQVSNLGRIKSKGRYTKVGIKNQDKCFRKEYIVDGFINKKGYKQVTLYDDNGKPKTMRVHKLVALAFIENKDSLPQINHIDGNILNNSLDNLEWCDKKYNNTYGSRIERASKRCKKKVQCIETGIIYDSAKDIEKILKINHSHISDCCKGKRNKTGGYSWRFVNE